MLELGASSSSSAKNPSQDSADSSGEIIDAIEEAASASDENTSAEVINEWFFIEPALEQLKSFAQTQMNNCIQGLALDLLSRKAGIVLQQNHFPWERVAQYTTSFLDFEFLRARHWDAQPHRDVVGDMVTADCNATALLHR